MKGLELKVLAYLPYNPKFMWVSSLANQMSGGKFPIKEVITNFFDVSNGNYKMLVSPNLHKAKIILRPLSDLTEKIEDMNYLTYAEHLGWLLNKNHPNPNSLENWYCRCETSESALKDIELLHEWGFDLYGLIESGIAISIHDLK